MKGAQNIKNSAGWNRLLLPLCGIAMTRSSSHFVQGNSANLNNVPALRGAPRRSNPIPRSFALKRLPILNYGRLIGLLLPLCVIAMTRSSSHFVQGNPGNLNTVPSLRGVQRRSNPIKPYEIIIQVVPIRIKFIDQINLLLPRSCFDLFLPLNSFTDCLMSFKPH